MTPGQWQQVKELFEAALDRRRPDRSLFIAEACRGDQEVRLEVESLLQAHEQDSGFMNEPLGTLLPADEPILVTGQRFGHYDEITLLGKGGMGQVYVAVDKRLGRKVALKLLPSSVTHEPAYVQRLNQEARAASSLNHPNIITIHDVGEIESIHFMATEFVEGETLRERMSHSRMTVGEVIDVATQVASALQAAHESGIVHRDIKPENIMLRRDGVVKVLDFGLAKLTPSVETRPASFSKKHTNAGLIMGTVAYMSPEQARGGQVNSQTDIWSLGVVVYEMIAGRAPFSGDTTNEVIIAIQKKQPPPLHQSVVPKDLVRIVSKALSKNPTVRYKTAGLMAAELKVLKEELTIEVRLNRLRTSFESKESVNNTAELLDVQTARAAIKITDMPTVKLRRDHSTTGIKRHQSVIAIVSVLLLSTAVAYLLINRNKSTPVRVTPRTIAVLPFKPMGASIRDENFETGTADVLINRLSSMEGLVVRSLNATRAYRDPSYDPVAAGKEQHVDYVISPSYQLSGSGIRIAAALVNVATGTVEQILNFEKDATDIFAMQDAIATEIGNGVQRKFSAGPSQRTAKRGTTNPEAYRLYLQGMYLANNRNLADAQKAIEVLEQAVSVDPNYARAWAGLGYVHRTLSLYSNVSTQETYQKSIIAINKALSLDPNLSEAHSALCENKYLYEWDFEGAERECKRAIELDPNSSQAHEIFSRYLMGRGRLPEALFEIETAVDLEPASRFNQRILGRALFYSRRYREAATQFKRVLSMDQSFVGTYSWLTSVLALQGNEAEAFEWFLKLLAYRKVDEGTVQIFKKAFETSGWHGVLREWLLRMDQVGGNRIDRALYNAQIGNKDKAFEILEEIYHRREIWMTYLRVEPRLDPLRADPRFSELLKRVESK